MTNSVYFVMCFVIGFIAPGVFARLNLQLEEDQQFSDSVVFVASMIVAIAATQSVRFFINVG